MVCAANAVALRSSYFSVACPIPDKCPKASQLRRQAEGAACANSTNCNNCCSNGQQQPLLLRPRQEQPNQLPVLRTRLVLRADPFRGRVKK